MKVTISGLCIQIIMFLVGGQSSMRCFYCHAWNSMSIRSSSFAGNQWRLSYRRSWSQQQQSIRSFIRPGQVTMMPEGPEVRTLVDQLQQGGAIGQRLVDIQFLSGRYVRHGRPKGFEAFAATMTPWFPSSSTSSSSSTTSSTFGGGSTTTRSMLPPVDRIQAWNAKGKFIYILLDSGSQHPPPQNDTNEEDYQRSIWITLGMSGRFMNEKAHQEDARFARWFMELLDPTTHQIRKIYYHDQRNFGTLRFSLSRQELVDKLESLGPDIMNEENFTEQDFLAIVKKQRPDLNVCKFLMDQSKLSGIGNYILAECLYRAKIDPFASLEELSPQQQQLLFREAQAVARESYDSQGMTRKGGSFRSIDGDRGGFEFQLQCYGRDICAQGNVVLKEAEGPHGRPLWYTEKQLFMPLQERKQQELARNQVDLMDNSSSSSSSSESADFTNENQSPTASSADSDYSNDATVAKGTADTVSYGNVNLASQLYDQDWQRLLTHSFQSPYFQDLQKFLQREHETGATIYPPPQEVFAALNLCPFDKVKVVIVGQDPYHGPGQGHGLAFSVQKGVAIPPSLQNIIREARQDMSIPMPQHGNLEHWARQGVLLLNTILTVRQGEANSHKGVGWETFTDEIIQILNDQKKDTGLVFLLWGNPAAKKAANVDETKHVVIRTSHPSPLGATKTKSPFLGSRCFSNTNQALEKMGWTPIDWSII